MSELKGVLPVVQTPYHEGWIIDEDTLRRQVDWLFEQGASGLTVALASEILRLTADERSSLIARTVEFAAGRGPVIASVGAESTIAACELARAAEGAGATVLMAIPPLSAPCLEEELRSYFDAILEAVPLPLVVQDASGFVGQPMGVDLQAGLFHDHEPRVMFKPEANPVGPLISSLREATRGRARIFEGSGGLNLVDNYRRGIAGTMPGADVPWAIVELWRALEGDDYERARAIQEPLCTLVTLMASSLDAFLTIEKHLLVTQGIFRNALVRGPLSFVPDRETLDEVDAVFEKLKRACEND